MSELFETLYFRRHDRWVSPFKFIHGFGKWSQGFLCEKAFYDASAVWAFFYVAAFSNGNIMLYKLEKERREDKESGNAVYRKLYCAANRYPCDGFSPTSDSGGHDLALGSMEFVFRYCFSFST